MELQFAPSKKTSKALSEFLKDFAVQVKDDQKLQLERERKLLKKENKSRVIESA